MFTRRNLLTISICLLAATTGWIVGIKLTSAIPAPNTNSVCEPGNCTFDPMCRAFVYQSGSQAVDVDGVTRTGNKVTGTDNAVLQDAINNVLDAGRHRQEKVCVSGDFTLQNNVTIPSNTILDLTNARFVEGNSVNKDFFDSGNYPASGNCDNVTIIFGTINGNKANNNANGSNVFYGCNHLLIDGTTVLSTVGTGFLVQRSTDVIIRNTHIFGTGADGLTCYNGSFNCLFIGNYISGAAAASNGILFLGTENVGQIASGNLEALANQIVLTNAGQGISVRSGADNTTISNNQISCATALCTSGSTSIGIYLFSQLGQAVTTRGNVLGNVIRLGSGGASTGININDDGSSSTNKQVSVLQNLIEAHTGIAVQGLSAQITVAWNDVRNTVTGISTGASITNVYLGYNNGFTTINSGVSSQGDGGTIAHGLIGTPTYATCTTSVANQVCAVTGLSSNAITLAIKVDSTGAAGSTQNIYWYAQYCPATQFRCQP